MVESKPKARDYFNLFFNLSEEIVDGLIVKALKDVKPEWLKFAIENDIDVYDYLFYNLFKDYTQTPEWQGLIRLISRKFWHVIEKYISNANLLYQILSLNPENKKLLDTPKGREWLNRTVVSAYQKFYQFVWL